MSNPLELAAAGEAALEDYLGHLCAPLVDVMPYEERQSLRQEVGDHLRALAAAREEICEAPQEAMAQALCQFGSPQGIGRAIRREQMLASRSQARILGTAAALGALVTMGVSAVVALVTSSGLEKFLESPALWALAFLIFRSGEGVAGGLIGLLTAQFRLSKARAVACGGLSLSLPFAAVVVAPYTWRLFSHIEGSVMTLMRLSLIALQFGFLGMLCGLLVHTAIDRRLGTTGFQFHRSTGEIIADARQGVRK